LQDSLQLNTQQLGNRVDGCAVRKLRINPRAQLLTASELLWEAVKERTSVAEARRDLDPKDNAYR
jgi:hypothetical protein